MVPLEDYIRNILVKAMPKFCMEL